MGQSEAEAPVYRSEEIIIFCEDIAPEEISKCSPSRKRKRAKKESRGTKKGTGIREKKFKATLN